MCIEWSPIADAVINMGVPTHVMRFSSGGAAVKDGGSSLLQFVSPLRQLDGAERWFITFYALPEGPRGGVSRRYAAKPPSGSFRPPDGPTP